MGAKYETNTASGYNSSPPADDGTQTAANLVKWSTHKTKLTDPLKTLAEAINTDLVAAFDYSVRQISASDSLVAGDHMRTVEIAPSVSTVVTVTLADAATMTNVYRVYIKNSGSAQATIARATSGDTIDGVAANTTLEPGSCVELTTNSGASGYLNVSAFPGVPTGSVMPYAGSSAPSGWLLCYGQAVSRSTYAKLFATVSTSFGVGDGSTTFNLPDLRGRIAAGKDDMGGAAASRLTSTTITSGAATLGNVGGAQTHTLTIAEMPAHTHTYTETQTLNSGGGGALANNNASANTGSTGGDGAHNNVQPTIILNYIIKT